MEHILRENSDAKVFAGCDKCHSGVLSFCPDNADCESFASKLSQNGVAVRAGLHCAPLAHESAGTLHTGTVRLSFGAEGAKMSAQSAKNILEKMANLL